MTTEIRSTAPATGDLFTTAEQIANWLDLHNGVSDPEMATRLLKVGEEYGEAAACWIGMVGQNPRKGITHTVDQLADELADVVIAALVAMASLGHDPRVVMAARIACVTDRLGATPPPQPF
jgi:hypothetical protein